MLFSFRSWYECNMNARSCLMISVISSALTPVAVIAFRHAVWTKKYCLIWRPHLSVYDGLNCLSYFCGICYRSSLQGTVKHLSVLWNWFSENYPLHKDINEFAPILSIFFDWLCESQCSANHTLLETVNEIWSVFYTFSSDLDKMLYRR